MSRIPSLSGKTGEGVRERAERPCWEDYFMDFAYLAAKRSTCLRRPVGAVIVKDRKILATGYNGAPSKIKHCREVGCLREKLQIPSGERHELCRGLHAEQNAIIQAAYHGANVNGADLFCTNRPCIICTKMIINGGIKSVLYHQDYAKKNSTARLAEQMIKAAGIKLIKVKMKGDKAVTKGRAVR